MFDIKIMSLKKFNEMKDEIKQNTVKLKTALEETVRLRSLLELAMNCETVCDTYCEQCIHGISTGDDYIVPLGNFRRSKEYFCGLKVPCKSFVQK